MIVCRQIALIQCINKYSYLYVKDFNRSIIDFFNVKSSLVVHNKFYKSLLIKRIYFC